MVDVWRLLFGRESLIAERGVGQRGTWHVERGIVNITIWRDD